MKKTLISLLTVMTLAVLLTGCLSLAENATEVPDSTVTQQESALEEAQAAYRAAKEATGLTEYEQELADMVANGRLTQEQADLLLKAAQDIAAMRNNTCPNCGYEFSGCNRKDMRRGMDKGMGMNKGGHSRR